jgi:asparagine synthase (glutamine-hydrolysing)
VCGLTGFLTLRFNPEGWRDILSQMSDSISHRGPSDSGEWLSDIDGIFLAHRRLSILDTSSAGHQPMISKSSRYIIVFNGEIYNHLELRKKLTSQSWVGHSDTETILACFEEWGVEKTLKSLSGMFSIVLWDRYSKKLMLARDRFGEKPLYYGITDSSFFFGSELKSLKRFTPWGPKEAISSVNFLLRYGYIPTPLTIYEEVYKLPAGSYLEVSLKDFHYKKPVVWWNYPELVNRYEGELDPCSDEESVYQLSLILTEAVKGQMISDVPIGALLSGGVDSSLITSIMQSISTSPIRTYTVGFSESKYDESKYAKEVARHLGTIHSEIHVSSKEAMDLIPTLCDIYDEPFADSSQVPSLFISYFASQQVKVCLSGDGADEIFGGYNRYILAPSIWSIVSVFPHSMRSKMGQVLRKMPIEKIEAIYRIVIRMLPNKLHIHNFGEKFIKVANSLTAKDFNQFYSSFLSQWQGTLPLTQHYESETYLNNFNDWPLTKNLVKRMMTVDAMTYLTDDILVKMDRASMSAGLEVRSPYLNEQVVEFALRCNGSKKIRAGQGKFLLRQLLNRYIPEDLINRPKQGFGVPIEYWLRGPLKDWAESLLSEKRLLNKGILNPKPIREMWQSHLEGKNYQYPLWNVLMYQAWSERWR